MGRSSSKKKRKFKENVFKEDEIKCYLAQVKKFAISDEDKALMRSINESSSSKRVYNKNEEEHLSEEELSDSEQLTENNTYSAVCEEGSSEPPGDLAHSSPADNMPLLEDNDLLANQECLLSYDLGDMHDDLPNQDSSESTASHSDSMCVNMQPNYETIIIDRDPEIDLKRRKLPCCMMEQEIVDSIRNNDVVLVTGDTGTGKSTQIPQFLYENGFCIDDKIIGITQTRRVACIAIAKQIGLELNSNQLIGYQIRFDKSYNEKSCKIKLMTDGILINELKRDILLTKYSVIIIDEAHERKINSDVLIGLLSQIVKLRRKKYTTNKELLPLKLVIMSATIRKEDFLENKLFENIKHVHIPSNKPNYTVHYNKTTPLNYLSETRKKILQIHRRLPAGSILVFLTGKQELYDLKRILSGGRASKRDYISAKDTTSSSDIKDDDKLFDLSDDEEVDKDSEASENPFDAHSDDIQCQLDTEKIIRKEEHQDNLSEDGQESDSGPDAGEEEWQEYELKALSDNYKKSIDCKWAGSDGSGRLNVKILHASQTNGQQMNCFMLPEDDERIVILSTNVAETSITIPNIRYVVDSGKEKRKVFNNHKEYENFEIFNISKASADQRAGRCGRLGHGHCYRLYTNSVFENMFPDYSTVEILETNLCSMVLLLVSMGINPHNFTYLTRPPSTHIDNAITALVVLGIVEVVQKETKRKIDFNYIFNDPFLLSPDQLTSTGTGRYRDSNSSYATDSNDYINYNDPKAYYTSKLTLTKLGRCVSLIPMEPRYSKIIYSILSKNIKNVNFLSVSFLVVSVLSFNGPFFVHKSAWDNENQDTNESVLDKERVSNSQSTDTNRSRNWTDDLEKYVWILCGYSKAENKVEFCNEFNINPRAFSEVFLLANQIYQIINHNFPQLSIGVEFQQLNRLKKEEMVVLADCIVEGLVDRIAIGIRHLGAEYQPTSNNLNRDNKSYRCEKMKNTPVYLTNNYPKHECVAYNYLMGDERIKMYNILPVNPTHLAMIKSKLIVEREIERNPVPFYEKGSVWAYVRRYYEPLNYFLTITKTKLPEDHPLVFRAFSLAFCHGHIYEKLIRFSNLLVVGKGDFFAPIGKRSALYKFIKKIHQFRIYDRSTFEKMYMRDRKFLLEEYSLLLGGKATQLDQVYSELIPITNTNN